MAILPQIFAFLLVAAVLSLGYWFWVRPRDRELDWQQRGMLLLILLTLAGGFLGGIFWWLDERRSFAWDVPPLASRMLASAAWAFGVVSVLALLRPTFRRTHLVMLLLFVYLVPLAILILLLHLDRFDPAAPITYSFFIVVGVMSVASTWYLLRPAKPIQADSQAENPPSGPVKVWLGLVCAASALWGAALLITDAGPSPLIWAWKGDLLSTRLIGVMLVAIAAGALYSLRSAEAARAMLAMLVSYSLGLALASLWNALGNKPVPLLYLAVFGLIFLGSSGLLVFWKEPLRTGVS